MQRKDELLAQDLFFSIPLLIESSSNRNFARSYNVEEETGV